MLHRPCLSAAFFSQLRVLDRHIAEQVHASGCRHCGHRLHVANYPRKPRGIEHRVLGEGYQLRWSFCCSRCRRRTTPPSLRFLGRKVYLGALLVLFGNVVSSHVISRIHPDFVRAQRLLPSRFLPTSHSIRRQI